MSRFSPYYAYQTSHPYAQYSGADTYPGNSILAVGKGGLKDFFGKGKQPVIGVLIGLAGAYGGWFFTKKMKKKQKLVRAALVALAGVAGFAAGRYGSEMLMPEKTGLGLQALTHAKPLQLTRSPLVQPGSPEQARRSLNLQPK